ncbi:MAG: transporter substrate-binding domain-containing protein [Colwellia sp.]|nr:transporter substrate-binding domain-containing protein [Colwellia sp.]
MLNILKVNYKVQIILLLLLISNFTYACTLTIAVAKNFPPYHIQNADGSWHGISIDIAEALVNGVGCQLKVKEIPWIRAIKLLEKGEIQLLSNYTQDKNRITFSQFIGPHHIEKVVLIAHKEISTNVNNVAMLSEFNGLIGITRGNSFGVEFNKKILEKENIIGKMVYIQNNINRHKMLFSGRVDAMFDDELSAIYLLAQYGEISRDFDIRFSLKGNPVYFGISSIAIKNELRTKLNNSWLKIIDSNTLNKIYQNYGLELDQRELTAYPTVLIKTK